MKKDFTLPCFDVEIASTLSELSNEGGESLITELYDLYSKSSPVILLAIENAFHKKDASGIQKQAHSLKSSSGSLGLLQMQERCEFLEKNANSVVAANEVFVIDELKLCFHKSLKLLKEYAGQKKVA